MNISEMRNDLADLSLMSDKLIEHDIYDLSDKKIKQIYESIDLKAIASNAIRAGIFTGKASWKTWRGFKSIFDKSLKHCGRFGTGHEHQKCVLKYRIEDLRQRIAFLNKEKNYANEENKALMKYKIEKYKTRMNKYKNELRFFEI